MSAVDLTGWHDFFVIVGSAAGALTGLMFVVIALTQALGTHRRTPEVRRIMRSFSTPTIVHFAAVLSIAGVLSMPGISLTAMNVFLLVGSAGLLAYVVFIRSNSRRYQGTYTPDLEDLVFHFVLPGVAYASVLIAVAAGWNSPKVSLYVVGGAMVGLLLVGIHNAWDSAVFQLSRDADAE